jgi:uncharacterized integral membrane protein
MRLIGIFLWIVFGAIILWFFTLNLSQKVDLNFYNYIIQDVQLVTVIFMSIFIGVVIGSLLFVFQIIKAKSQLGRLKKEYDQLIKERDSLSGMSFDQNFPPPKEESSDQINTE